MKQTKARNILVVPGSGGSRYYQYEGEEPRYPSVTTITGVLNKPALVPWAKKMALEAVREELLSRMDGEGSCVVRRDEVDGIIARSKQRPGEIAAEAADIGRRAHEAIERIIGGEAVEVEADIERPVNSFLDWYRGENLRLDLREHRFIDEQTRSGGTVDCVGRRGRRVVLLDWKTSKGIWPEYALQVGGYALGYQHTFGVKVAEAWIVRFPKSPAELVPFEAKRVDLGPAMLGFRACRTIFDVMRGPLYA